jgi:hypothetical protein
MRTILLSIALAAVGSATERTDIEGVISAVNDPHTDRTQKQALFTSDAQNELDRLASLDHRLVPTSDGPLSEVTMPRIVIESVRFITADVALVDAANTQYGSVILMRRLPVLLVMKKEGQNWRIAALRVLINSGLPYAP